MAVALSRPRGLPLVSACCRWLRLVCARCLSSDGVASAALALRETMALWSLALIAARTSGVCASPAAFYGSIRIATGAAVFELGDVR